MLKRWFDHNRAFCDGTAVGGFTRACSSCSIAVTAPLPDARRTRAGREVLEALYVVVELALRS
jgi:hypothetical protein